MAPEKENANQPNAFLTGWSSFSWILLMGILLYKKCRILLPINTFRQMSVGEVVVIWNHHSDEHPFTSCGLTEGIDQPTEGYTVGY